MTKRSAYGSRQESAFSRQSPTSFLPGSCPECVWEDTAGSGMLVCAHTPCTHVHTGPTRTHVRCTHVHTHCPRLRGCCATEWTSAPAHLRPLLSHRGSERTAPTWPSCSACPLPPAASSASACWTHFSTRSAGKWQQEGGAWVGPPSRPRGWDPCHALSSAAWPPLGGIGLPLNNLPWIPRRPVGPVLAPGISGPFLTYGCLASAFS